jgi:hypothetical protein
MLDLQTACTALRAKVCLQVSYDRYMRVVEVHACGYTKENRAIARVWQVRGGSASDEPVGWKLLRLDEAAGGLVLRDEQSQAPRHGYKPNYRAIARIVCQIDPAAVTWPSR